MSEIIERTFKDKIYVGMLASICESMDDVAEQKDFNLYKAKKLHNKYVKLVEKTYRDSSRPESDINSWCLAFSHAYEPSSIALSYRMLSELQKHQTLQSKNKEGGN